jgi:hypothetical protein
MTIGIDIVLCAAQFYVLWVIVYVLRYGHGSVQSRPVFFGSVNKARLAVLSMAIVSILEFATTLYDINGPGGHFPLGVRIPVLTLATILLLKAL